MITHNSLLTHLVLVKKRHGHTRTRAGRLYNSALLCNDTSRAGEL